MKRWKNKEDIMMLIYEALREPKSDASEIREDVKTLKFEMRAN